MRIRIFFTGVGGQGILLATRLIGEAALVSGLNVAMSEVHGMAQRGGVVESAVVIGNRWSPVLADGEADIMVAFEPLEALRALPRCHENSTVVMNTVPIPPFTVTTGNAVYPPVSDISSTIKGYVKRLYACDALRVAREAGSERALNVVLVGTLVGLGLLPIDKSLFGDALEKLLPDKLVGVNIKALEKGFELGEELKENRA